MKKIKMQRIKDWLKRRKNLLISTLIIGMVLLTLNNQLYVNSIRSFNKLSVLSSQELPPINPLACLMSYPLLGVMTKICVKKDDEYVSKSIIAQGAWEEENVILVMKSMRLYEDAVFVDAGSNIGMYTIMVAAMGREVVAVDAMSDNLAYIRRSLELANKEHLVTLAHNAISDNHDTVYPVKFDNNYDPKTNPGSLRVTGEKELLREKSQLLGPSVGSVTLPDVFDSIESKTIILKIDIQGYECKALLTPGMFSSDHFIPYIFLEWELITTDHEASLCPNLDAVIDLLKSNGYSPMNISPLALLADSCLHHRLQDMLWIHEAAEHLWERNTTLTYIECK